MNNSTLFDTSYQRRKWALLERLLERLVPIYTSEEVAALRIDAVDRDILSQRSGRGFVDRDLLETVFGQLARMCRPWLAQCLGAGAPKPVARRGHRRDCRPALRDDRAVAFGGRRERRC